MRLGDVQIRFPYGGEKIQGLADRYIQEKPLRAELLSLEQLEQHAQDLARQHQVSEWRSKDRLLPRLADNEVVLQQAYRLLSEAARKKRQVAPAGEWLLDNYYLIIEQIRTIRRHLPKQFSRELPNLVSGPLAGFPRVYDIALNLISHLDGRVTIESLSVFIESYQKITFLKLGELWAIPIMLRLALLENLRRVSARIAANRLYRDSAQDWAERMKETVEKNAKDLILVMADMVRANPTLSGAFVAEFSRALQGQDPILVFPLTWLEQSLNEQNQTVEQMVQIENQQQASDQVSIGNSIGGLRFLASLDWREFVETMSRVELILRDDPADVYTDMDFATRDQYRHRVEELAKYSPLSEIEVASKAVDLARLHLHSHASHSKRSHVGFYLIDQGQPELDQAIQRHFSLLHTVQSLGNRFLLFFYLGGIFLLTFGSTYLILHYAADQGLGPMGLVVAGILSLLGTSQTALGILNGFVSLFTKPKALPKMDFSDEIPTENRTLIVIPTLLNSRAGVEELLEGLEVRYLANRDVNLHYGLVTDFTDAKEETKPSDHALLQKAREGIQHLNQRYAKDKNDLFYLFHRPRRWNPSEKLWMGRERKRGKLEDLNALLRGKGSDRFSLIEGNRSILPRIRYVISLDTDTQLPRDSVRQLVGTLAHPLNRPIYDPQKERISEGYGILQPRVAVNLPSANQSRFVRIYGGDAGIDPYTRAVSDLYQDLFQEGSFIGKGIYDVDALVQSLEGRFPENLVLSHDLIEGCYARSGLISDVVLFENHPSRYQADMLRRHRWIRGDWQIALWALGWAPNRKKNRKVNALSGLSWWKILDNVRRSLAPASLLLLLLLGWLLWGQGVFWTLVFLILMGIMPVLNSLLELMKKPKDLPIPLHLQGVLHPIGNLLVQAFLNIAFLPYEAYMYLDAIVRSLVRVYFTQERLLEWQTAGETETNHHSDLSTSFIEMRAAPAIAVGTLVILSIVNPGFVPLAGPFLFLWLISPALAWWISRPLQKTKTVLPVDQMIFLHRLARKIWRYFEVFVGPGDHWLPPDNYQEYPVSAVAHRTSPTNMGLSLAANLCAHDFGYISLGEMIERFENSFQTMHKMDRYKGHFFNWYDTQSLRPLHPFYISTVDSGNLAALLLTIRLGFRQRSEEKIVTHQLYRGLRDTLGLLAEALSSSPEEKTEDSAQTPDFFPSLQRLEQEMTSSRFPDHLTGVWHSLQRFSQEAKGWVRQADIHGGEEVKWWAQAFEQQCRRALQDLEYMAPWLPCLAADGLSSALQGETFRRDPNWQAILRQLETLPSLREMAQIEQTVLPALLSLKDSDSGVNLAAQLQAAIKTASDRAGERIHQLEDLAQQCEEFAEFEYEFLYDRTRNLLTIGYNVSEYRRDNSLYDLLASEARLASYIAIAKGHLPQEHWFALGRLLTSSTGIPTLLSWSGSMFEYLMPLLVMPTYENTLLDQTYKGVVERQIKYGRQHGVPWGVSESGYNATDLLMNYQYRAFGVPGLGFKRGLAEDLVIAPYACMLGLMVAPIEACRNLRNLSANGFEGSYGLYEAIDYTQERVARGKPYAVVRSFMAHHQGMSFLSLAYVLLDRPMQKRFQSDPLFQAVELLLHEKIPKAAPFFPHTAEITETHPAIQTPETIFRVFRNLHTPVPETHLLSNGRYHVWVTHTGGSYSQWRDLAITRWREDTTCDSWGAFCYVRDTAIDDFWSVSYQPVRKESKSYEAVYTRAKAEYRRSDYHLDIHTEISVSPEDDIELHRINISNRSRKQRILELTSYAEVVLNDPAADLAHPAFSNLFVQTEIVPERNAVLGTRRPRSSKESQPWMFHLMTAHGATVGETTYETDRSRFIGRGNTAANPEAMQKESRLSNSEGSVLDPIVSIRRKIVIDPFETARVDLVLGAADSREVALGLVEKYHDRHLADRVFDLAWTHAHVTLQQLNATESDAQLYGRLAGSVIYTNPAQRANPRILVKNRKGQPGLWGYGISGDLPIMLLRIGDSAKIDLVRHLVQAHAYWRMKGLRVDLVIWNEDPSGYRQALQDQILGIVTSSPEAQLMDKAGGIFVLRQDQISEEDQLLIQAAAKVILTDRWGDLSDQIKRWGRARAAMPRLVPLLETLPEKTPLGEKPKRELVFFNGHGGFTPDGREYVIITGPESMTPAPWSNVMANANCGSVITESGGAYTWFENAHEYRLTPWHNDPVSDASGEAYYVRDEETGRFWSPTPRPARGQGYCLTRHGFGYSAFECIENGIFTEFLTAVAMDAPVKIMRLKVRNDSGRVRRLSVTGYVEWVLGDLRSRTSMHINTELDPKSGALVARNQYNQDFSDHTAFFECSERNRTVTGDRGEFIGRNGTLTHPNAMYQVKLSGNVGAAYDPCAALMTPLDLQPGHEKIIVFTLGAGRTMEEAQNTLQRYRSVENSWHALEGVWHYWNRTLGAVYVETPNPAVNVLANGWLLYQTLACRIWARSGFYQSGGAFGFRDQLQDSMALLYAEPALMREHLLRCAARQYKEGDVQHWWHPPTGRGVRTHFSDDYLWLPLAVSRYVLTTGDRGVLEETVPFLDGPAVRAEEESYYAQPHQSGETGSLYEHCKRALQKGFAYGSHGLPLIGCGDWNDGMNLVGAEGKGESVWLAFFLYEVLRQFETVARQVGDTALAEQCMEERIRLKHNIKEQSWDGQWYRRAYFDNGDPLGSQENPECKIDSLPQSWSVLSGGGEPERSKQALDAVDRYLIRRNSGLIQLFDPPFDQSNLNPGYIKGYVPGVRENGGQYTHAAIWTVMAFAIMGDHKRAWELLEMINPIRHTSSPEQIAVYKVEPYVVAADVYAVAPHTGRGGWTWYTGSAGWMYRLIVESLLGLRLEVDRLHFDPCLPEEWKNYAIHYRYRETFYHLFFTQKGLGNRVCRIVVDGVVQELHSIPLFDDRQDHRVEVEIE